MPDVIHADQNAHDGWFEIERVLLPAFGELRNFVSTHTTIEKNQITLRIGRTVTRGNEKRITVPKHMIRIAITTATAVGDGIALKEDATFGFEQGNICLSQ